MGTGGGLLWAVAVCFISSQKFRRLWHQCFLSGFLECSFTGLGSFVARQRFWGNWRVSWHHQENPVVSKVRFLQSRLGKLLCWKEKTRLKQNKTKAALRTEYDLGRMQIRDNLTEILRKECEAGLLKYRASGSVDGQDQESTVLTGFHACCCRPNNCMLRFTILHPACGHSSVTLGFGCTLSRGHDSAAECFPAWLTPGLNS